MVGYRESAMKKYTSLVLAMVSTMFLAVGATKAAERFDTLSSLKPEAATGVVSAQITNDVPLPCIVP